MRIWDINPGYLNDKSLLGEHREIHAIHTVILQKKKGYSHHPETLRWRNRLCALALRHGIVVEEMKLRNFNHKSPLENRLDQQPIWPDVFIDPPHEQYEILKQKYQGKPPGRIPLPLNTFELWANHKYSVMAREPALYSQTGATVASGLISFEKLSNLLALKLREAPEYGRIINAVSHMWGYLKKKPDMDTRPISMPAQLAVIQKQAMDEPIVYLQHSTALGELAFWASREPDNINAAV